MTHIEALKLAFTSLEGYLEALEGKMPVDYVERLRSHYIADVNTAISAALKSGEQVTGALLRTIIANDVLIRNMRHRDARWHDDPDVAKVLEANRAIIKASSEPNQQSGEQVGDEVERVAKAIYEADDKISCGELKGIIPWENAGTYNHGFYIKRAKAAISAMQERGGVEEAGAWEVLRLLWFFLPEHEPCNPHSKKATDIERNKRWSRACEIYQKYAGRIPTPPASNEQKG
jgi:hypothetical protein